MRRTRIAIDYSRCGDGKGVDPRDCGLCLRACEPALFLLHQTLGADEVDPLDAKKWRVTPLWPSLCSRCGECVAVCPQRAISVRPLPQEAARPGRAARSGAPAPRGSPEPSPIATSSGPSVETPETLGAPATDGGPEMGGAPKASETRDFARCLVIGGSGMLGFEIVKQLVRAGKQVRILDLQPPPEPICESRLGDLRCREDVTAACAGLEPDDVIFQTAAAVWDVKTPARVYEDVNVGGNQLVLGVCRELGLRRLVYTSTIDVVVEGRRPIVDGDESLPYPERMPKDAYSRTKIVAERLVLAADTPELATCALRPVGMYGPRDRYHLGNIVAMAKKGNKVRLGNGSACFSHAYSENVAQAHVLAGHHLFPGSNVAGKAYFIGDHYPAENFFDFMQPYLEALDLPVPRRTIPYPMAYALACVTELIAPNSNFNRFAVIQTCVDHTYRHDRAERDFGYRPFVSREEAFRRSLADLKGSRES